MKLTTKDFHIIDFDYVPENPIVVDAGSLDATFIGEFNKHCKCIPYIIEADSQHLPKIKYKNLYHRVLGGDALPDEITFYSYGHVGWGSIYYSEHRNNNYKCNGTNIVKTLRINDIFDFLNIDRIDYLKLDIEGAEFNLFRTMTQDTADRIKQISCEVHDEFFDGNGIKFVTDRLHELNFSKIEFSNDTNKEIWCVK